MDVAEGSYGQLFDHFNDQSTVDQLLSNLWIIFITHLHADHHLGTIKMIHEWLRALWTLFSEEELMTNPDDHCIYVIVPYFMQEWILDSVGETDLVWVVHLNQINPEPTRYY